MRLMHSFLLGLALAGLANTALAGPPAPPPGPLPSGPIVTTIDLPVVSAPVVSPAAPCCGVKTKHVCVPEVAPRVHTHVCYSMKRVHICLPYCSAFGGKCDKGCGQGECGK